MTRRTTTMRVDSDETRDYDPDDIESDESSSDGESKERRRYHPRKREKYLSTFKDVENYIGAFNGDDGKNVKQ